MKRILRNRCGLIGFFAFLLFAACNQSRDKQPSAGSLEKETAAVSGYIRDSLQYILKRTDEVVVASVKTTRPLKGVRYEDRAFKGVINYNTRNSRIVSSRVSGRIEKLYVKYNYQLVRKGQKLMEIYSPDLANAQQELLFLKNNGNAELIDAARRKLLLLGATGSQIDQVLKSGKVNYRFSIYSPYSGYITEGTSRGGSLPASGGGAAMITAAKEEEGSGSMGGMNAPASPSASQVPPVPSGSPVVLTEGEYISTGQTLFNIMDNSDMWAEFYVPESESRTFKNGAALQVGSPDIKEWQVSAKVGLVQPFFKDGTNFVLVRATIQNDAKRWKAGQIVDVTVADNKRAGNWLLRPAVLRLGSRYVVFIKKGGVFIPAYVNVAAKSGDWYDVGNSLPEGTEVAENAWFMVDSESFIRLTGESQSPQP